MMLLNYSEDEEALIEKGLMDTTGQTSDSYGHDGGGRIDPTKGYCAPQKTLEPNTSARRNPSISSNRGPGGGGSFSRNKKQQVASPSTMVSSDVSLSSSGTHNNSNNPSSPPPRYRRVSPDQTTEVWYAKWWMCGFTDALNINSNY